jgi:hypothetical protein
MKSSTSLSARWIGAAMTIVAAFLLTELWSSLPTPTGTHSPRRFEPRITGTTPSGVDPTDRTGTERPPATLMAMPPPLENPRTLAPTIAQLPQNEQESFQHALNQARYGIQALTPAERAGRPELTAVSHRASNPAQDLMVEFMDNGGLRLQSGQAGKYWRGTLRLRSAPKENLWKTDGIRASRASNGITEWYENRSDGLEHGFTLTERPSRTGEGNPVVLRMSLGELRAECDPSREGDLVFADPLSGEAVIGYRDLKVWDANGIQLAAAMRPGGDGFHIAVNDGGARYPLTIDPLIVSLERTLSQARGTITYFKASNTMPASRYGTSVAISGDTLVVGAFGEQSVATGVNGSQNNSGFDDCGAAYVFVRSSGIWTQQAYLKASNTGENDSFGLSVAISGDTIVIGAPGEDSAATGVNGNQNNNSADHSGAAYVFVRSGTTWSQQAYLKSSNTGGGGDFFGDSFGCSVAISGDSIVVGAYGEDSNSRGVNGDQSNNAADAAGAAYVFVRSGANWIQQAYLKTSDTAAGDYFGASVSISGDTIVGAATGPLDSPGAAYVFTRSGASWTQQARLLASNRDDFDRFGESLAIAEDTIVVGASGEESATTGVNGNGSDNTAQSSGAAYVFVRSGLNWAQQAYLKASNTETGDLFGTSVAIFGNMIAVGALKEESAATGVNGNQNNNAALNSGAAYLFLRTGSTWAQQSYIKASNTGPGDEFGASVGISGDAIIVGAPAEGSAATGVNGDQNNNSSSYSGAAYVYSLDGGAPEDHFGLSVDVDGDTAVVGELDHDWGGPSAGKAWVFRRTGAVWNQEAGLLNNNPAAGDRFGVAVAVSGNRVIVGADYDDEPNGLGATKVDCGSATVFERNASGVWNVLGKLSSGQSAGDSFGRTVAIDGDTLAIGAPHANFGRGQVWTYGLPGFFGQTISAPSSQVDALFGFSVAVSGSRIMVGAPRTDSSSGSLSVADTGRVYFFKPGIFGYWEADGELSPLQNNTQAGFSVAMNGNVAVVGCSGPSGWAGTSNDSGRSGKAFVLTHDGIAWVTTPQYLDATGLPAGAWFGMSVAVENGAIAVGAFGNDTISGKVRIFRREGTSWIKQQDLAASGTESDNAFGVSVGWSGNTLIVGGYGADSAAGTNGGMAWIYHITDPDSLFPVLTISRNGTNAILTWPVTPGWTLQRSPTLQTGSWQTVTVATDGTHTHPIVPGEPRMFFRLQRP